MFLVLHIYGAMVLTITGRGIRTGKTSLPAMWGNVMLLIAAVEVAAATATLI